MTRTCETQNRKMTSQEIARRTGVSRTTVSYVLSGREGVRVSPETRRRILDVARQAGYRRNHLAQALITGRMYSVGIVTHADSLADPENTYIQRLFVHLTLAVRAVKMNAMTFFDPFVVDEESEEEGLRPSDLTDGRVDGVLLVGFVPQHTWVDAVVQQNGIACVEINSSVGTASVLADHQGGTRDAVEHLLHLGHRRFVYFSHPESTSLAKKERIAAFQETLRAAGVAAVNAPIIDSENVLADLLRRDDRPTAVLTFNDERAHAALGVSIAAGLRVPQDLSLVGFDDDMRAVTMSPRLTTVATPFAEMAEAAVASLLRQIEYRAAKSEEDTQPVSWGPPVVVPTRLIVRESTGPVPFP